MSSRQDRPGPYVRAYFAWKRWSWLSGKAIMLFLVLLTLTPAFFTVTKAATGPVLAIDQAHLNSISQTLLQKIHVTHHSPGQSKAQTHTQQPAIQPASAALPAYNNVGTSDDSNPSNVNFDGNKAGYSTQVLASSGLVPGQSFQLDGANFVWPAAQAGLPNNYVVSSQVIPITPVANTSTLSFLGASSGAPVSGTATLTYTDASTQSFTLGMSGWTLEGGKDQISYGNLIAAKLPYYNAAAGKQVISAYVFYSSVDLQANKTIKSVTLPASGSQGQLHIFAVTTRARYNNVGSSDDTSPVAGNVDGIGDSYSNQALVKDGVVAGQTVTYNGTNFTWPAVAAGAPNNYQAYGQTIPITPVANAVSIGFLGAATHGAFSGAATLTYTDGSTQNFTLSMSDWTLNAGQAQLSPGNSVAFSTPYHNTPTTSQLTSTFIFYTEINLQAGKTLQSLVLPTTSATQGVLHIFAIGTRDHQVTAYNNVGTSDDSTPAAGNFDGSGSSYSGQALQAVGLVPGKQLSSDGIFYTWPNVPAGSANNYQASGQTLPVTSVANAVEIGFLGAAVFGNASGTATITYTDGSTQSITLGFTDWLTAGAPAFGNTIVATSAYHHSPSGTQNSQTYVFGAEFSLQVGKIVQSVTLPSSLSQGQLHIFAVGTRSYFNNIGISDDHNTTPGQVDTVLSSYSSQEFINSGWQPCDDLNYFGMDFTWPCVSANMPDNYQAQGQTIPVTATANADTIGFIGASTSGGPDYGTAIINYSDGSQQAFTLGMSDWLLNGFTQAPSYQNRLFAGLQYHNTSSGQQTMNTFLFYAEQKLQPSKTVQSVTLPSSLNQGQMHIFSIATGAMGNVPNSVGSSLDESTIFASHDSINRSYSEEALKATGIYPGQSFFFNGVHFNWTESYSVIPDNYIANGQTISVTPVPNANTLAFVGSATGGPAVGQASITYTDGSTQGFTLGFSDWVAGTTNYGNTLVANMPYHNTATGKETGSTFLFYADTPTQPGKTIQSVTLPANTGASQLHIYSLGTRGPSPYNNAGTSNDNDPIGGNFDGNSVPASWSVQALQGVGITPGANLSYNGVNFTWPNVPTGSFDNYQANGQTIAVTPVAQANTLAFLGDATYGPSQGTAIITYTDGSTQTFSLGFTDWSSNSVTYGNLTVASVPYVNIPQGRAPGEHYVYYTDVSVSANKTIQSVTLPTSVNAGAIHVFAVGTRAGVYYNSAGISDDSNPGQSAFDLNGDNYSAEGLKNVGITPGQPVAFDGIPFTWPNVPVGALDNYAAVGQTIPVTPVANAVKLGFLGASTNVGTGISGTATITYTDGTTQAFTLGMSDWTLNANTLQPSYGNLILARTAYTQNYSGQQNYQGYVFGAEVDLQAGKTVRSVTLPVTSSGFMHIFATGTRAASPYNNAGTSDDASPATASFDNNQISWSAQALQSVGITPGAHLSYNGVNFTWPNVPSGGLNNYQAAGQTIPVTPVANANTLAFLGDASHGNASGTATITYTDGSTQTFTLGFTDWWSATAYFNNTQVATVPYINTPSGKLNGPKYLYYAQTSLQAGKTIKSVTLPATVSPGLLNVFAISTRAGSYYNSPGISDDSTPGQSFFDNSGNSYSAEALKNAGIVPGQAVAFDGIPFTWPNVPVGALDNYTASGQTIPVTPVANAVKLGFLGSSTYAGVSGTATITYTDGATQSFTLGMSDWMLSSNTVTQPSYGNQIVATTTYTLNSSGQQNTKVYIFGAEVNLQVGKMVRSVTLPISPSGSFMHIFAIGLQVATPYNNAGISDDAHPTFANFDSQGTGPQGTSYSDQALQAAGLAPGKAVKFNGVNFTWPNMSDGLFDNYQANGQLIPVSPVANATTLAFLGSAVGTSTGTGTITYTDGSTQSFTLSLTDWAVSPTAYGNQVVATMPYRNTPSGKESINVYVFYTDVTLQSGKTLQSVTLPSFGTSGTLHVFAVGTK